MKLFAIKAETLLKRFLLKLKLFGSLLVHFNHILVALYVLVCLVIYNFVVTSL